MEMENEKSTTQARIDLMVAELEKNGRCCESLAADLPAIIANIEAGETLDSIRKMLGRFATLWHHCPSIQTFFLQIVGLLERDATRRALMENIECGELEKIGEL
jgi:hypothetical protein